MEPVILKEIRVAKSYSTGAVIGARYIKNAGSLSVFSQVPFFSRSPTSNHIPV